MAFDLLLDQLTNDLVIEDRELQFTTRVPEELRQRVGIRLRTFRTEWFIDLGYGVPYLQEIIGQTRSKSDADTIILSEMREEPGVNAVSGYTSSWDKYQRIYSFEGNIVTPDGLLNIDVLAKPTEEFEYPNTGDDNSRVDCGINDVITYANRLYYFINYEGLPKNTYATWVNNWS